MGWPIAFLCFALLQWPGLSRLLSSFSDPSCQVGICASALCLSAHCETDFRHMEYPPSLLSSHQRAEFAHTSIRWLDLNQKNSFLPRVLSIQGGRCARTEEGTFPDVLRCVLFIRDQGPAWHPWTEPPLGPVNSPAKCCDCFHLEVFPPCCVTSVLTMDSLLLPSLICLWHADLQKAASQTNKLHFTPVHLQKLSSELSTPSPTLGKNAWEMVDFL